MRSALWVLSLLFVAAPVIVCRGQTLSGSKLSAHLINDYTTGSSNIVYGKPVVLKVLGLDSGWPSGMVSAMRDYKTRAPSGKLVVRIYSPKQYSLSDNATWAAGDFWTNILKRSLDFLLPTDRALIDYLEGPNEGQTPTLGYPSASALEASHWFNQFWTNLTPRIAAAGCKPCIGSIAVGNPGGDVQAHLAAFVPALRQAKAAGGAWSYHAYTIQYTTDVGVEYWYSLRYRQFYEFFAASYPDLLNMPLILTEGGVDDSGNPSTSGWRARGSSADYQRWLNWFDDQLRRDSYVTGCTLFQNGDPGGWWSFELEPIAAWMRDYLLPPTGLPAAPTGVSAAATGGGITLTWTNPPANPSGYTVRRATNSAGPYWVLATNVTAGVRASIFTDSSAAEETDYYYRVACVNAAGEGPSSTTVAARINLPFPAAVNSGGGAWEYFLEDMYFEAGTAYSTGSSVSTNGLTSPAPAAVYQSQRYGNLKYRLRTSLPRTAYRARLHFAEVWWTLAGQRTFDVLINDAAVLENFDIVAQAGGPLKGTIREFNAISDATGDVSIQLITRVDNASINGIELIPVATNAAPSAPTGLAAVTGSGMVTLKWTMPPRATACAVKRATTSGGPYTVIASNLTTAVYRDVSFVPGTTYYYVVSAANAAGESLPSGQVLATPTVGLPDAVITEVGWAPAALSNGTRAVFWARVLNRGSAPTPSGVTLGVGFNIDGAGTVSWSGSHTTPVPPNASIVLYADGGPTGNYWTAVRGSHTLFAAVDDINRFQEAIEGNNVLATNLFVHSPRPVITGCVVSNSTALVSWRALAGAPYVLQSTTGFDGQPWEFGDPLIAGSTNASAGWSSAGERRFFRVLQLD